MPKYIKADALIDDFLDLAEANKGTYHEEGFKNAITVVEMQPAADVVEVVRCKDCVHWDSECDPPQYEGYNYCFEVECRTNANDFCSFGER